MNLHSDFLVDPTLRLAYQRDYIGISPTIETLDKLMYVVETDNDEQLRRREQGQLDRGRTVFVRSLLCAPFDSVDLLGP